MQTTTRIDNAEIWINGQLRPYSLLITGEKVGALLSPEAAGQVPASQVIDASRKWLLPGGVDLHVHISDGIETFTQGSSCAAAGGITTVCDMAPFHGCITPEQFRSKSTAAEKACLIDFGLIAGIVIGTGDLAYLDKLAECGAPYFKVFQPSDPPVSNDTLWAAVQVAAHTGLRLGLHAEETACLQTISNTSDPIAFPRSRPPVAETSAVAQLLEMAYAAGAPVHICHVSTARTVEMVNSAKARGVDVTCEVAAHYLYLDEEAYSVYGARVKTTPPLRTKLDCASLWKELQEGVIDAIASDHYVESLSPLPKDPFYIPGAPTGIAGLEISLPLLLNAVLTGNLSLKRFVEATSSTPAKIAGLSHAKGSLAPGMDADFVLWDPHEKWKVASTGDFSRLHTTPFMDWELYGRIYQTWLRGQIVWNQQHISKPAGYGRRVHPRRGLTQ